MGDLGTTVTISNGTVILHADPTADKEAVVLAVNAPVRVRPRGDGEYLVCVDPAVAWGADKRIVKVEIDYKDDKALEELALQVLKQMEMERQAASELTKPLASVEILTEFLALGEQLMVEAQEEVKDAGIKQEDVDKLVDQWKQLKVGLQAIDEVGELDIEPQTEADIGF